MYKVNGLLSFPVRRRLRELDFRVPEDSLSVDEGDAMEVRSPGIDRMIEAYYDADHAGDESEKAAALRGMIDEMTALHKLRGVPVFAHPPLPPQFVAAQVDGAKSTGGTDIISKIASLIEPNNRPAVKMQLEGSLAKRRWPLAGNVEHGSVFEFRDTLKAGTRGPDDGAFRETGSWWPSAVPSPGPVYDEFERPPHSPPVPQKPYRPRAPTQEDVELDRIPESEGGPRDDFRSTGLSMRDPRGLDLKPFDPQAGYYERLARRADELRRQGLVPRSGVDIDGRPYDALLRVGTDKGSRRVTDLTPRGVEELMRLFADDVKRFETVDEAVAYFASVYAGFGDPLTREEQQKLKGDLSRAMALAVDFPTKTGAKSDRVQTIIVINENMRRFRDPRSPLPAAEQDAETLAHEVGHIISDIMGLGERLSALPAGDRLQVGQELSRVYIGKKGVPGQFDKAARNPEEWIAVFFMFYLLDPERAKREAPMTAAIVRKWWNENPAVNRMLILSRANQGATSFA